MYNYDFKDEKVIHELNNCFAEINGKELFINILITDKNILLFYDNSKEFVTMKTQGIFITPSNDLILSIDLNKLNYKIDDNNTIINDSEIVLYDFSLTKLLKRE